MTRNNKYKLQLVNTIIKIHTKYNTTTSIFYIAHSYDTTNETENDYI